MNPKQTVVNPVGQATQPNEFGVLPPGSMKLAENVQFRRKGVLEPRNGFVPWKGDAISGTYLPTKMWATEDGHVIGVYRNASNANQLRVLSSSSNQALTINPLRENLTGTVFDPGKTQMAAVRDRYIFTDRKTPTVLDAITDTTVRQAGLQMPLRLLSLGTVPGDTLDISKFFSYRALVKRDINGYIMRGPATPAIYMQNPSALIPCKVTMAVYWGVAPDQDVQIREGDVIEFYRTKQQETPGLLGDDFMLCGTVLVTAAEMAFGGAILDDICLDPGLGAQLYEGEARGEAPNWMPPPSTDVCTFKGITFYASAKSWQGLTVQVPNRWGLLNTAGERTDGIGYRGTTANYTIGNVVLSVADVTGLVVGQQLDSPDFALGTLVTAIVGSNVTVQVAPSATRVGANIGFVDVMRVTSYAGGSTVTRLVSMQNTNYAMAAMAVAGVVLFPAEAVTADLTISFDGLSFDLQQPISGSRGFSLQATNGQNYIPAIPELGAATFATSSDDPRTNRVHRSKFDQPEAVPVLNYDFVGHGTILRLFPTQEALLVWCSDGLFRLSVSGSNTEVRPLNPDLILLSPDSICSLDNVIYAWTTEGFGLVNDSGSFDSLSRLLIDDELNDQWQHFIQTATPPLPFTWGAQMIADKYKGEIWLNLIDYETGSFRKSYIWNTKTNVFTTQVEEEAYTLAYAPFLLSPILATFSNGFVLFRSYDKTETKWMDTRWIFNPVVADDTGLLKQWIDVTLLLENVGESLQITPQFDGVDYANPYLLPADAESLEHVVAPLLNSVCSKHCKFGATLVTLGDSDAHWQLMGLTYRYRLASDSLGK